MSEKIINKVKQKLAEQDIEQRLKKHDWHHPFSDSNSKYMQGQKEEKAILKELSKMDLDEALKLWNKHAPSNAKKEKPEFEKLMKVYKDK